MMRLMGGATVVALGVMLAPVGAHAQVNARVEISAAVAGSSATLEVIERQANALDRARQAEIAALQTRLTEAEVRGASEVARLQAELIAAREALVADLAARDRAYAEEIAVFRNLVTSIASTPEGAAALARVNAGDGVGGVAAMDSLRRARAEARRARAEIENAIKEAAEAREVAAVALDLRGKSDPAFDTGAVIARYEEVVRLDPGEYNDWYQLVQLYIAAGRRAVALAAAERLEALANNDQNRSTALVFTADILLSQGDRAGALSRYQRSLEISERLSAADPASAVLARDVSVSLSKVGDVLLSQSDRDGALARYQRSLEIRERLSAADPASADLARDVSVSLNKIGDLLRSEGDLAEAVSRYQRSLAIAERLSAADPASMDLARDVSVSLERIGDVLLSEGDRAGALSRYQRSLAIAELLSAADPASVDLASNVSVSLDKIGDVLRTEGDRAGAMSRYQRSLEIREGLSAADPASADRTRDVFVSCWMMAQVTGERRYVERALGILKDLEARGALAEADRPFIAQLEEALAAEAE